MDKTTIYLAATVIGGTFGMIGLLFKKRSKIRLDKKITQNRIKVIGNNIFLNNESQLRNSDIEIQPVLKFEKEIPEIQIFENNKLIRKFVVQTKKQ